MSASASKKKRQLQQEQGPLQRTNTKELEEKGKKKRQTIIFIAVCALAVAAIIGLALLAGQKSDEKYAPDYDTSISAATVGSYEVSVPFYNYFYFSNVNSNASLYSYFYGLQYNVPFAEQSAGDQTFEEMFIEQTNTTVEEYINIYNEAVANGVKLTSEDQTAINDAIKEARTAARGYGFSKLDNYLAATMGKGCNEKNYREYLALTKLVSTYYAQKEAEVEPTAEEVAAEYAANADTYDYVLFTAYNIGAEETETEDEDADPVYSDEELARVKSEAEEIEANFDDEGLNTDSYKKDSIVSLYSEEIADWLFDTARKEGDVKAFCTADDGHSYSVIRYDGRDDNNYALVNAYVVAISREVTGTDEDGASISPATDAIIENLKSKMAAGLSDEAFEKLMSDNGYTAEAKEIKKGTYQDEVFDFLYSADRKAGDYDVFSNNSYYYIVRYVDKSETTYQYSMVYDALKDKKVHEWYDVASKKDAIVIHEDALAYANTNLTLYSNQ